MSRTKVSTLLRRPFRFRVPTEKEYDTIVGRVPSLIIIDATTEAFVGMVEIEDLFDHEGNYFENDVDLTG